MTRAGLPLALALAGCSNPGAIQFTGTAHPPVVTADGIDMLGRDVPAQHEIIGVITARCETIDGASGLLERPCTEDDLLALARERAAAVGATGLVDNQCRHSEGHRMLTNVDGGGVETALRASRSCQATVVRRTGGPMVGSARTVPVASQRRVDVSGVAVEVGFDGEATTRRDAGAVGEMDAFPAGYAKVGRLSAECVTGCPRSSARRALRIEAARVGALAIAEIDCALLGQRWRCQASAVGTKQTMGAPDASADSIGEPKDAGAPVGDASAADRRPGTAERDAG